MADQVGQADIRGIDIDAVAKGYADEMFVFKRFVTNSPTSARENRWFQKTSGVIDTADSTAITASQIDGVAEGALPHVAQQSWTRNTSYIKKYFIESPWITEEDIMDSSPDVLATHVRDLVRAVQSRVDAHIFDIMSESQSVANINSVTTTAVGGDQWDAASGQNPLKDIMRAKRLIRQNGYDPEGGTLLLDSLGHESLLVYLISTAGANFTAVASDKVQSGVVMNILGLNVVVSENVVTDYALVFAKEAATWKSFGSLTSAIKTEEGIGRKIRVWEWGICILTDPKAVTLIVDLNT